MKKSTLLLTMLAVGHSHAALSVLDFTNTPAASGNPDTGAGITIPAGGLLFADFDFLGDGRTADITITAAGTGSFSNVSAGVGVTGGTGTQNARIGLGEDITLTFSDFQGGLTAADIRFTGFIAGVENSVFVVESGDVFSINGAALTGTDAGDGTTAFDGSTIDSSTLVFDNAPLVFQNLDSGGVVGLNGSDAFVLDLTTDAGGGYRLQGVALDIIPVPEPSSTALIGLGGLALIMRRRRI